MGVAVEAQVLVLHHDAFAADYQEDKYSPLGMAIKYAGLCGKEVNVVGKNRPETLKRARRRLQQSAGS